VPEKFKFSFSCSAFTQLTAQFSLGCMGSFTVLWDKSIIPVKMPEFIKVTFKNEKPIDGSVILYFLSVC
jgi:hypothetical protein